MRCCKIGYDHFRAAYHCAAGIGYRSGNAACRYRGLRECHARKSSEYKHNRQTTKARLQISAIAIPHCAPDLSGSSVIPVKFPTKPAAPAAQRRESIATVGACCVPRSQQLRDATNHTFQISKEDGGLTRFWADRETE